MLSLFNICVLFFLPLFVKICMCSLSGLISYTRSSQAGRDRYGKVIGVIEVSGNQAIIIHACCHNTIMCVGRGQG